MNNLFQQLYSRISDMKQLIRFNKQAQHLKEDNGSDEQGTKHQHLAIFRTIRQSEKKRQVVENSILDMSANILEFNQQTL